jgi:hypothetical protein
MWLESGNKAGGTAQPSMFLTPESSIVPNEASLKLPLSTRIVIVDANDTTRALLQRKLIRRHFHQCILCFSSATDASSSCGEAIVLIDTISRILRFARRLAEQSSQRIC